MNCPRCGRRALVDYGEPYCLVHGSWEAPFFANNEEGWADRNRRWHRRQREADPLYSAKRRAKAGLRP